MADTIGNKAAKDYHLNIPAPEQGFFAKGLGHGDWGTKNRLSRLFNPVSGNTVMLAFDHGYIMGSTAGLERMDVTIAPPVPVRRRADGHPGRHPFLHPPDGQQGHLPPRHP